MRVRRDAGGCQDAPEFAIVVTAPADSHQFEVYVEPEAMSYGFPATGPGRPDLPRS